MLGQFHGRVGLANVSVNGEVWKADSKYGPRCSDTVAYAGRRDLNLAATGMLSWNLFKSNLVATTLPILDLIICSSW